MHGPSQSINPNAHMLLKSFDHLTAARFEKWLPAADNCFQTWRQRAMPSERSTSTRRLR